MSLPKPYYEDGSVTIYHGDALAFLPDLVEADVLVTDPPYGMGFVTGRRRDRASGWTSRWTGQEITGDRTTEARDSVMEWWGQRPALVFGTWKVPAPAGVRETLVWDKVISTGMGALDIPWRPSWECIYVLGSGFSGRRGHGVLRFGIPTISDERKWHPTPKPVALLRHLIERCPAGTVLDPFMGSGTTLRAAKDLGRKAIGIELEERYCEIAAQRCSQEVLDLGMAA